MLPQIPTWAPSIQLDHEREALGCYVSHHPVRVHDHQLKRLQVVPLTQLPDLPDGKEVRIIGIDHPVKRITTKRQQPMAFVHLEDQDRTLKSLFSKVSIDTTQGNWNLAPSSRSKGSRSE